MTDQDALVAAVEQVLAAGGDADDVLRGVVTILHEQGGYRWAAVTFLEDGQEVEGPLAGEPEAGASFPIEFNGQLVAYLHVAGAEGDRELPARVAELIAPHALVGWDTGGEEWVP